MKINKCIHRFVLSTWNLTSYRVTLATKVKALVVKRANGWRFKALTYDKKVDDKKFLEGQIQDNMYYDCTTLEYYTSR